MKYQVWHHMDKSKWAKGPWTDEPDKIQFMHEETGYPCLIVRNWSGSLCGYVGVNRSHPDFQQHYDKVDVDVHGGLTFSDMCQPDNKEHGICHIVEPGEDDVVWWLGFDCGHYNDLDPMKEFIHTEYGLTPYIQVHGEIAEYRTVEYVTSEIHSLARQLKERENVDHIR